MTPKIVNENGMPVMYLGSYKFKNTKDRRLKYIDLEEMSIAIGFKVRFIVVTKSKTGNNKMMFGAIVPEEHIKKMTEEVKSNSIQKGSKILGIDGKPLKN